MWLAGHEYKAEKNGIIIVPFSTIPGRQPIVITAPTSQQKKGKTKATYSSLDYFTHVAENYAMKVDFHIDRESLLARKKASLIIRPLLSINGIPLPTKLLEDVKLTITSTNIDGTHSSQEIPNVRLFEDRESIHEFQVPRRLASLTVSLTAKVKQITTGGTKVTLNSSKTFALNGISKTAAVEDLHLLRADNGYVLELRGRTGEPKSSRPVVFAFVHRDFNIPIQIILKTNPAGRIQLHSLAGIVSFSITSFSGRGPHGIIHRWNLKNDRHTFSNTMHAMAGKPLTLPYMGTAKKPQRSEFSLLELRGTTFVTDRFENIAIRDGLIVIDKLPAGDYDLFLKKTNTHVKLRLAKGKKIGSFIVGDKRQLEVQGLAPLQIQTISTVMLPKKVSKKKDNKKDKSHAKKKRDKNKKEKYLRIQLKNVSKFTRLHILATRYVPQYDVFANLSQTGGVEPFMFQQTPASSVYLTGRNIGDEYRYIIERKYTTKYPGNMLARPSLLLNPWAVRPTATSSQVATDGERFSPKADRPKSSSKRSPKRQTPSINNGNSLANLDFLAHASTVLHNLVPDKNGLVEIPFALLGPHQHIHIVAIDPLNVTYRSVALKEINPLFQDLRLLTNLQSKSHHTRQKKISIVPAGKKFILHDVTTSKFEAYDNLEKVYGLYTTLGNDTIKLVEFSFILDWTTYKQKKKQKLYSQYACHELNFFLFKKDPQFFKKVVQPYLQNKKDKTFIDHFLLNHNLSTYLTPWKFSQLNMVERILLAQRVDGEQARTARHLADRYALLPPDIDGFIARFDTAIQQSALKNSNTQADFTKSMEHMRSQTLPTFSHELKNLNFNPERGKYLSKRSLSNKSRSPLDSMSLLAEESVIPFASRNATIGLNAPTNFKKSKSIRHRQGSFELDMSENGGGFGFGGGRRRQLYRQLDQTFEWAENNYYHLTINQQNANLITVNAFWKEYAAHQAKTPFLSTHLTDASRNFPEMMFALSVLDLPFKAPKHKTTFKGKQMTLIPGGALIVFHEEIRPANKPDGATKVLVSQNFFKQGDRQRIVNGETVDKFVTEEFIIHTVYGCQVVITNPTSTRQKLNVLVQIPKFAIPVSGGEGTKTHHIDLKPYSTKKIEYYFYFPIAGDAPQFPVHIAKNEKLIASATPVTLHVVKKPSKIDTGSWDYISQQGSLNDVLTYIDQHNIENINLAGIAWRMQDKATYNTIVNRLAPRHVYNQTLWSFSLKHNDVKSAREFLQHSNQIVNECGGWINSPLLTIDLTERKVLEHFEYKPLVNARAHTLGARRKIVNDRFVLQYHHLLNDFAYRRTLSDENLLVVTYYLLLQDRVDEAIKT
ncbi:hypothetical protein MNBD_PLANCTO02-681, partial [hydrothermal vent metagenome]